MDSMNPDFSCESSEVIWSALAILLLSTADLGLLLWGGFLCPATFLFLAMALMIFPVLVIVYVTVQEEGWESLLS